MHEKDTSCLPKISFSGFKNFSRIWILRSCRLQATFLHHFGCSWFTGSQNYNFFKQLKNLYIHLGHSRYHSLIWHQINLTQCESCSLYQFSAIQIYTHTFSEGTVHAEARSLTHGSFCTNLMPCLAVQYSQNKVVAKELPVIIIPMQYFLHQRRSCSYKVHV